jgi:hypothetical protein
MARDPAFPRTAVGKVLCPTCRSKLGSWNWRGVKYVRHSGSITDPLSCLLPPSLTPIPLVLLRCQCGRFCEPAFQLVPSRVEFRAV